MAWLMTACDSPPVAPARSFLSAPPRPVPLVPTRCWLGTGGPVGSAPVDDIRHRTVIFSGILTREEFDEAFAATSWFRQLRWLVVVAAVLMGMLSLRPAAHGGPINAGLLMLALVYGVLGLFLP